MKTFMCIVVALLLTACTLTITISNGCTPTPPAVVPTATATRVPAGATPTPVVQQVLWDNKLTDLGVTITPGGKYRLIAAWTTQNGSWDNVPDWARQWQLDTLGGDHHAFGRCLDLNGMPIGKTFQLSWPGGTDARTPEPDGWANLPISAGNSPWNPADGQGPFTWMALNGDKLVGLGMPLNHHWSFFGVWQEQPATTLLDMMMNWFWPR